MHPLARCVLRFQKSLTEFIRVLNNIKLHVVGVSTAVNKSDIVCVLNLPASTLHTIYTQRERILKGSQVTIGSASSEVVSFSQYSIMDKCKVSCLTGLMGVQSMVCIFILFYISFKYTAQWLDI